MKGMHEIWYFDGRGQNSKFYKFENTLQRIYSTWENARGDKLIGKHITLTKPKILKISETNEIVLGKFTNPLCLKASLSSSTARSAAIAMHAR